MSLMYFKQKGVIVMKASEKGSVDLLSIVIIICILVVVAAVLLPMFARTGGGARKSVCACNLKECAIALQTYSADYNNHLPSSMLVSHSKKWNRKDFIAFATKKGKLPAKAKPQTWVQLLYPYMRDKDVIFCPSDASDHSKPNSQTSYWWKCAIDRAWYGEGCKKPCKKQSDFAYPEDQIVLYERSGFHTGEAGLRNGTKINVVYLDTHVRNVTLVNSTMVKHAGPTMSCEPAYFNFDQNKGKSDTNPPPFEKPTHYIDPGRYSDMWP